MDVRGKLIKICFREFCDIAGDSPCGCDGCPYGEYDPDNGGCFDEYKKDKIEKLENDMDKYQKEDNGVTVQEWISVDKRLPENFVSVLGYMTDAGEFPPVRECYTVGNAFFFPALGDVHPVSHWCEMPQPPKGE